MKVFAKRILILSKDFFIYTVDFFSDIDYLKISKMIVIIWQFIVDMIYLNIWNVALKWGLL